MRILCVDDDVFVRDALYVKGLAKFLPNDEFVPAESGEQAVELLGQKSFDIVITDFKMPGMDGIGVLRHVKENFKETEVILVTGAASIASAVEAIRLGARDYIEKPISLELLVEKIANIRDYQQRVREAEEFRMAKECTEAESGRQLHSIEMEKQKIEAAVVEVWARLPSGNAPLDAGEVAVIRSILAPFVTGR